MIEELAESSLGLFGNRIQGIASRIAGLQTSLINARMPLTVEAYASFMILISTIVLIAAAGIAGVILTLVMGLNLMVPIFAVGIGFVAFIMTFAVTYKYPSVSGGKYRRTIEANLPYTVSFMGILSAAGVSPKRIFRSLARFEEEKQMGLGGEAKLMYRDMEVMGSDMVTALKDAASRNISPLFSGVMDGMVSTIRSGGEFSTYLESEANSLMRLRKSIVKEFLDSLMMISEMYMSLLVAFPLIMIVMLVVMSSIGGGTISGITPESIVPLITYGMIPAVGAVVIMWLDSTQPRG